MNRDGCHSTRGAECARIFLPRTKVRLHLGALVGLLALALACAPTGGPSPQASTASSGGGQAAASASSEWDQIVAAAKREGEVSVYGPPPPDVRDVLTLGFQQQYPEIKVTYTPGYGGELGPKVLREQEAGRYLGDLLISGTTTLITTLMDGNALDPIRPSLVGPESDPSKWMDNRLEFADDAQQNVFIFSNYIAPAAAYNTTMVNLSELKSWRDLLDPKWNGRLVMHDPRQPGAGLAFVTMLNTKLGREYLERFFATNLAFSRQQDQLVEFVSRGRYAMAIATQPEVVGPAKAQGLPIDLLPAENLAEGTYVTPGYGAISLLKNAPHPNAAKVYLNFLIAAKTQEQFDKASLFASRRRDVPRDQVPSHMVPKEGVEYHREYQERWAREKEQTLGLVESLTRR
jgi:iron(III) transport system substrate-binding protein